MACARFCHSTLSSCPNILRVDALESHDFSRHFGTPNVMGDGDVNFPMGQVRCSCRRSMLPQLCHFFMDLHETGCVLERIFLPFKLCLARQVRARSEHVDLACAAEVRCASERGEFRGFVRALVRATTGFYCLPGLLEAWRGHSHLG